MISDEIWKLIEDLKLTKDASLSRNGCLSLVKVIESQNETIEKIMNGIAYNAKPLLIGQEMTGYYFDIESFKRILTAYQGDVEE